MAPTLYQRLLYAIKSRLGPECIAGMRVQGTTTLRGDRITVTLNSISGPEVESQAYFLVKFRPCMLYLPFFRR
ncbi:hypothetical protein DPMN_079696 [Dreissena polymorpha]|uniref:Uncharacterized protein n=1 Tax=Dreissena polymorpha TaxID=45954 RepID=A0A9D3YQ01_DREPO|nr:hypothetical protein DPMN_079696 [Dreissena polymorpha]